MKKGEICVKFIFLMREGRGICSREKEHSPTGLGLAEGGATGDCSIIGRLINRVDKSSVLLLFLNSLLPYRPGA